MQIILSAAFLIFLPLSTADADAIQDYCEREFGGTEMHETCLEQERAARARMVGREVDLDTWAFCASTFPDSYAMQEGCMDVKEDVYRLPATPPV